METILTPQAMVVVGAIAAMAFSAVGSGLGCGLACNAAIGAWKKCYMQNKAAPFQLMVFGGAPLTQTFYGFVLQFFITQKIATATAANAFGIMLLGMLAGMAIGFGAYAQGRAAASSADAFAETGKGFANFLIAVGIVETVTVFAMAFGILLLNGLAA